MDVQGMRSYVRAQMQVDDEELPDTILNVYLEDAYGRTLAADNRWPRQEMIWDLAKLAGADAVDLPPDMLLPSLTSVSERDKHYRLTQINQEAAEDRFNIYSGVNVGIPLYYSLWARKMYLWPTVATDEELLLTARGYSQPAWSSEASALPALDPSLHIALCYYAISLAYAGQEDEILEGVYLARWDRDIRQQIKMLLQPPMHRPLVMHGGATVGGVQPWVIVPPPEV